MPHVAKCLIAICALAASLMLVASPAHAGTLTHFSCRMPDGAATNVAAGWTTAQQGNAHASVDCGGGGIAVGLSAHA